MTHVRKDSLQNTTKQIISILLTIKKEQPTFHITTN